MWLMSLELLGTYWQKSGQFYRQILIYHLLVDYSHSINGKRVVFDQFWPTAGALPDVLVTFNLFSLMGPLLVEFSSLYCKFKPTDNRLSALGYRLQTFHKYCRAPARGAQTKPSGSHTHLCWMDPSLVGLTCSAALRVSVSCINGVIKEQGNR